MQSIRKMATGMATAIFVLMAAGTMMGQGCILARSPEQTSLPTGQGGELQPGHLQLTIGLRHQYSYKHYVGDVYQEQRAQLGNQMQNKVNLITANLTYQWKPRISFEVDMPYLFASRKLQNSPIKYQSNGVGDIIVAGNYWLLDPMHAQKHNLSLGLGLLMPTGNDDVQNNVNSNTTGTGSPTYVTAPVDYSIQPGNGGWGMVMQWMGYRKINQTLTLYSDGDYIATQGGTNGIARGATQSTTQPLNNQVAISDQYLAEAGLSFPLHWVSGLTGTVSIRDEGVPAANLFPVSNDGFRRPGYAVSAGPGAQWVHNSHIFTANIYKATRRDRTSSYPDSVYSTHGDAAFAEYLGLASWTHRF